MRVTLKISGRRSGEMTRQEENDLQDAIMQLRTAERHMAAATRRLETAGKAEKSLKARQITNSIAELEVSL